MTKTTPAEECCIKDGTRFQRRNPFEVDSSTFKRFVENDLFLPLPFKSKCYTKSASSNFEILNSCTFVNAQGEAIRFSIHVSIVCYKSRILVGYLNFVHSRCSQCSRDGTKTNRQHALLPRMGPRVPPLTLLPFDLL